MIYKASFGLLVGLALIFTFQSLCTETVSFLSNALAPILAGAAVISSGFTLQKYWHRAREPFSIVWLCFTLGLFLWFVGEAAWAGYTLILGIEVPYPSVADALWLIGYIPLFIALFLYVKIFRSVLSRNALALAVMVSAISAVSVSVALVVPIMGSGADSTTMAVDLAYPILDFVLFSVALSGLLVFVRGNLGKSWALITSAIVLTTFADALFSYTSLQGTYYSGHPIDLLYLYAYMFFLLAFHAHAQEL